MKTAMVEKLSFWQKLYGAYRLATGRPIVRQSKGFFCVVNGRVINPDSPIWTKEGAKLFLSWWSEHTPGKKVFMIYGHVADFDPTTGDFNTKWYKPGVPMSIW